MSLSQDSRDIDASNLPGDLPPLTPALAEGEAVALAPMDETPDSAPDEPPTRIPHLGHALLFLTITTLLLLVTEEAIFGRSHALHAGELHPKLLLAAETVTYLGTLAISFFVFPPIWKRPFLTGLQWNGPAAIRNLPRLMPLGLLLSFVVQGLSNLISIPKTMPMNDFFHTRSDVWLITIFGIFLAPMFEEILFRGFLLPAVAIAYDWLCLPRTEAARAAWQSSNALSRPAIIFAAIVTSVLFALLHGQQTAFTWPILALLFCVSLVLTAVRVRLRSVAASTLVHATYNATVFLAAFLVTGGYQHLDRLPK